MTSIEMRQPVTIASRELDTSPHEIFCVHRSRAPVILRDDGVYIVLRAADVENLASDPRTRQLETEYVESRGVTDGALFDLFNNTMLMSSGLDHRRRRAPASRAFAYKLIMGIRPRIRQIANELIDRKYVRGEMNLRDDFAARLPALVICEILGIPPADIPRFTQDVYKVARAFSSSFAREDVPILQAAARDLISYHPRKHLVFGLGAHRCLGEVLATVELEEGLAALTARLPEMRLAGEPAQIRGGGGIRTVENTWVCWPRGRSGWIA